MSVSLRLPVLQLKEDVHQTCEGQDTCSKCPLLNKFCGGRNSTDSCGVQTVCETNCNECHGEDSARLITGVCCKSPLAPFAIQKIQTLPQIRYHTVPKLVFPDERIPVLIDRQHNSPAPVNCISLHRCYSMKGWKSKDMKDYLQLGKKTKLILLSSAMHDNYLDNFMEMPWYETAREVGFDYWDGLGFSTFLNQSRMQNLFMFWRILRSVSDSGAHFVPDSGGFPSLLIDQYLDEARSHIPNVFINASHGSQQEEAGKRITGYVRKYSAEWGPKVAWFVQGISSPARRKAFRSLLSPGVSCYFFITPKTGARRSKDQYGWFDEKPKGR